MRKIICLLLTACLFLFAGCAAEGASAPPAPEPPVQEQPQGGQQGSQESEEAQGGQEEDPQEGGMQSEKITVNVGGREFSAVLEGNDTAAAFFALLPLDLEMRELNGNEKYFYLGEPLPSAPVQPGTIQAGDIMLYGSDCIVLFFESFSTRYSYTRIGRIEDASALADAAGSGTVRVSFSA